jgi:hypothetical protein
MSGNLAMPPWVQDRISTNFLAQAVYMRLRRHANGEGKTRISREQLAKLMAIDASSVGRGLTALRTTGCIVSKNLHNTKGHVCGAEHEVFDEPRLTLTNKRQAKSQQPGLTLTNEHQGVPKAPFESSKNSPVSAQVLVLSTYRVNNSGLSIQEDQSRGEDAPPCKSKAKDCGKRVPLRWDEPRAPDQNFKLVRPFVHRLYDELASNGNLDADIGEIIDSLKWRIAGKFTYDGAVIRKALDAVNGRRLQLGKPVPTYARRVVES